MSAIPRAMGEPGTGGAGAVGIAGNDGEANTQHAGALETEQHTHDAE
jgi:hypothetical protein